MTFLESEWCAWMPGQGVNNWYSAYMEVVVGADYGRIREVVKVQKKGRGHDDE